MKRITFLSIFFSVAFVLPVSLGGRAAVAADTQSCPNVAGDRGALSTCAAVPAGTVLPFAGITAPPGYLLCDGSFVSRTTFATLFSVIQTVYGAGDGSTTFALPDLRGRAIFGKDDMNGTAAGRLTGATAAGILGTTLGSTGGEEAHLLSVTEMPTHNHVLHDPGHAHSFGIGFFQYSVGNNGQQAAVNAGFGSSGMFAYQNVGTSYAATNITIDPAGGNAPHNITPPAIILNYIIKY